MKFEDLNLSNEILNALEEIGYLETTTIQEKTIPLVLEGEDVIGLSQTGTGKTAAFGLPIIQKVDIYNKKTQSIIMCPTRELAVQVADELTKYSKKIMGMRIVSIYGGQSIDRQIQVLNKGAHIVVGTPGRIMDHLRRKTLKLNEVKAVILDEADEMLNMGFEQDVETILQDVPEKHQTVLFSATMNDRIMKVINKHLQDPITIKVKAKSLTVDKIEQYAIEVRSREKDEATKRILEAYKPASTIVFCNTKMKVDELVENLKSCGYKTEALHGDIKQSQRDKIIQRFKKKDFAILIATDVAARGIDIKDISLVLNYDLPKEEEYYVHRIGRTGRNGEKGLAISFIGPKDKSLLASIEKYARTRLVFKNLPTDEEINKIRTESIVEKVQSIIDENNFENYRALKILKQNNDIDTIAKALFKMMTVTPKKENKKRKQAEDNKNEKKSTKKIRNAKQGNVKLFLNVGKMDKVSSGDIARIIETSSNMSSGKIGRINIMEKFCFVEVPEEYAKNVLNNVSGIKINDRNVNVEIANK